jgi:RHS repeat-associated protein
VNADNQLTQAESCDPFGNTISLTRIDNSIFGCTGQQMDSYIKLIYLRSRMYDPASGRFVNQDPFPGYVELPQSQNPYTYANNNPINYSDPTGQCISVHVTTELVLDAFCETEDWVIDAMGLITTKVLSPDANDFWGLVFHGMLHFPYARITGQGLQSIENDPRIIQAQEQTIQQIQTDPRYGRIEFTPKIYPIRVVLGKHGDFIHTLLVSDPNFWMVYNAMLHVYPEVSADGTIKTTWQIVDSFDFEPDWFGDTRSGGEYWKYNVLATIFGWGFYDSILHGAPEMPDTATWTTTIYPGLCTSEYMQQ